MPLVSAAVEILKRYPNKFADHNSKAEADKVVLSTVLPVRCDQVMNRHLKTLGQMAGMIEVIVKVRYSGKERIETVHKKYELLSTHAARRSFVTLGLEFGIRSEVIMSCSGHTDTGSLRKYVTVREAAKAQEVRSSWNF